MYKGQSAEGDNLFLLTMLRHPAQRLMSEYLHLRGGISCHGSAWKHYQPELCSNGSILKPSLRWAGQDDGMVAYTQLRDASPGRWGSLP